MSETIGAGSDGIAGLLFSADMNGDELVPATRRFDHRLQAGGAEYRDLELRAERCEIVVDDFDVV